jgi:prepilin signal peptidase PulO-like enzyme (type II secretory pathway)
MIKTNEAVYAIPSRYRRMENMHIVFWLLKDISWCMIWRELGLAMFIPTLIISIIISWRTRQMKSELAHNLAITFWISANGYWMISEFFHFDTIIIWQEYTGKHLALIPFLTGALILLFYYTVQRPRELREHREITM